MITHYKKVVVTQCEHFPELVGAVGFFDAWKHASPRGYKTGIFAPINGYDDILLEQYFCTCKYTAIYEPSIFDFNCRSYPKVIITSVDKFDAYYYKKDDFTGLLGYFRCTDKMLESGKNVSGEFYPLITGTVRTALESYFFHRVKVQELKGKVQ